MTLLLLKLSHWTKKKTHERRITCFCLIWKKGDAFASFFVPYTHKKKMGAIHNDVGCQIDCMEWPVSEQLPIVAECLHSLPIGWTYLSCVSEGVCFAHVKIGSTRKNVVCDKAVYLSVVDNPLQQQQKLQQQQSSSSTNNFVIEELQLEIELRDMISFEGRIFRRK